MRLTHVAIAATIVAIVALLLAFFPYQPTKPGKEAYSPSAACRILPVEELAGSLTGGGATFQNPQQQKWARRIYEITGGMFKVNYQSIGSGAGQAQFVAGGLDFAGSDVPLKREYFERFRGKVLQVPIIAGAVVVVYNLPELKGAALNLTGELLADIFMGKVGRWCDEKIRELNPGAELPCKDIVVVHRSDGSGTTALFTAYLSKVSEEWRSRVGHGLVVEWPVDLTGRGVGGKGNEGVTAVVQKTPYSIGYVEYAYAIKNDLPVARIRNAAGEFVEPSKEAVSEGIRETIKAIEFPELDEDLSDVAYAFINPPGRRSYPIIGISYLIIWKEYPPEKCSLVYSYVYWILTEGQGEENVEEGYLPIPSELAELGIRALEKAVAT